eukprot:tig00000144_g9187.t1
MEGAEPPGLPLALEQIGADATRLAHSVESTMASLRGALAQMTSATGQHIVVHAESVDELAAVVDEAAAKQEAFAHRVKELENTFADVERMGLQVKQIRREVDLFEELLQRPRIPR